MKLTSFRILNCFGFHDSGKIDLLDPHNFIYVLGRNSSGKSSLLNSIKYLELGVTPFQMPNFQNFNDSGEIPVLIGEFSTERGELQYDSFQKILHGTLGKLGIDREALDQNSSLKNLVDRIETIYEALITHINSTGAVAVFKNSNGHFRFRDATDDAMYKSRKKEIEDLLRAASNTPGHFKIKDKIKQINLLFYTFEDLLFRQFPSIYLFNERYSLRENLPERIGTDWATGKNAFEKLFVQYLDEKMINRFLASNDPDERETLLKKLEQRVIVLTEKVNRRSGSTSNQDLLEIKLHEKNGIQITVKTDGKKSYYSHLSENTRFLFAYHLYQETKNIQGDILLFDEPNNGFHPTAQEFMLKFLQQLSSEGNLVIVATHSEHLIDLDRISGIRLMSVDKNKNIIVKNHFYNHPEEPGDYLALQPLLDAIGVRNGSQILLKKKINITEGITDLLYIRAFNLILGFPGSIDIAPGRGDGTIFNLVPLFIAQGIGFKIVLDVGDVKQKIQSTFGIDDKFIYEVPIPSDFVGKMERSGIEDLFTKRDFEKLLRDCGHAISADFKHVSNSHYMKTSGHKRVAAQQFCKSASSLSEADFETHTIENFRALLNFCKNSDWFLL